jgi:glyoxylase-like metal-dependent hydrolase (beta-lactamase superfamily II)
MTSSRRGFLRATLSTCWTGAALLEQAVFRATQARAMAVEGVPRLFDIEKVAPGVYAAVAKPAALINCNAAIFENANDLLIVDTHSKPSAVISLVSQIKRDVSQKPVRYIVNSHFHWDHTQGTPTYRRIMPHADVLSSEATRRLISENGSERLKRSLEETQRSIARYEAAARDAKTPEQKQWYTQAIREAKDYLNEMKNYAPELPNVTLSDDLIIHDKAHDLHLAFRGKAHTAGDVIVYCPQKKVIATGDALHGFAPFIADGYPTEWPNTLLRFAQFDFDHVIGGHGGVQQGKARLYQMAQYIDELTTSIRTMKSRGTPIEKIQASLPVEKIASLRDGAYGEFLMQGSMKYRFLEPGKTQAELLAATVNTNIAEIYNALDRS